MWKYILKYNKNSIKYMKHKNVKKEKEDLVTSVK